MLELEIDHNAQGLICWRFAAACQDIEDYLVAGSAGIERFADGGLYRLQPIVGYGGKHPDKAAIGFVPAA
jgi:hypothetical protein